MRRKVSTLVLPALVLLGASLPAAAQPRGALPDRAFQARFGGFFPEGGGDLWIDNEDVFTLEISDFNDFVFGMSYVHPMSNRLEVGFNVDFYEGRALSAYRDVFEGDFPIFHDTVLGEVPLTLDLRWFPAGRYRTHPSGVRVTKPTFYLGAGLGAVFWEYEELGDFVDFGDPELPIFPGRFKDNGTAFQTQLSAGFELPMSPRFHLVLEGRYSWADDKLSDDFAGFGTIELGGGWVFVAGSFRF
jgi:hypothetical protein